MVGNTGDASAMPNKCPSNPAYRNLSSAPAWNGWGVDATNGRFQLGQSRRTGGRIKYPGLKLKWAFGFPGATAVYGQPTLAGGQGVRRCQYWICLFAGRCYGMRALVVSSALGSAQCDQHR